MNGHLFSLKYNDFRLHVIVSMLMLFIQIMAKNYACHRFFTVIFSSVPAYFVHLIKKKKRNVFPVRTI